MIVQLTDYVIPTPLDGSPLGPFSLGIRRGDIWGVESDSAENAHLLLRALATLVRPSAGRYRFNGELVDFADYRSLLPYKKQIGYVAADTALISNRTVRGNLMLMKTYFDGILAGELDDRTHALCRELDIDDRLDMRPSLLDPVETRRFVLIRELQKKPAVLLIDRPEDCAGHVNIEWMVGLFKQLARDGTAVVYVSDDDRVVGRLTEHTLTIQNRTFKASG